MDHSNRNGISDQRRLLLKGILAAAAGVASSVGIVPNVYAKTATSAKAAEKLVQRQLVKTLRKQIKGDVFWRGDVNYETARRASVWRMNTPKRFPSVIVVPKNDKDVVAAVKFAKQYGFKVGKKSGGHSWQSPFLRDDAMLIDLVKMQDFSIDPKEKSLWTSPAVLGSRLNKELEAHNLIVPTAHHLTVAIGGFAMCGGFGWNSRLWGNGCAHIMAIDIVNAEGELIRADETQNQDYLWAARGAGPGIFGIVTKMKMKVHDRPPVWRGSYYKFPMEVYEELFTWARNVVTKIPLDTEMVIVASAHDGNGVPAPVTFKLAALAICNTEKEAADGLAWLETCPVINKALIRKVNQPTNLDNAYASGYNADPAGFRFACDNMYTVAPAEQLVPAMKEMWTQLPTPRTHIFWHNWGPVQPLIDMAHTMQADVFMGAYTIWEDEKDDDAMLAWPPTQMKKLSHLSAGGQLNDENMLRHPQAYLTAEADAKLERLRAKYDPSGVFLSWLREDTLTVALRKKPV